MGSYHARLILWLPLLLFLSLPIRAYGGTLGGRLTLEAAPAPDGARISVLFSPQFDDCRKVLIDRVVAPAESDVRPVSLLKFTITDETSGQQVRPKHIVRGDMKGVGAGELILTSCRNQFGWPIDLREFPWLFDLADDTSYRVEVCLVSKAKTFYARYRGESRRLVREFGFSPAMLGESLLDFEICADEFRFTPAKRK